MNSYNVKSVVLIVNYVHLEVHVLHVNLVTFGMPLLMKINIIHILMVQVNVGHVKCRMQQVVQIQELFH